MRKDMSKVVTERPREGHYLASRKTRLRIRRYDPEKVYDDLPLRVSGSRNKHLVNARKQTRSRYDEVKHFSDLIGPLQRFLHSNVGRPWDDVYSEMKQSLDSRKVTGRHIFEHVEWEVELHPVIGEDGKIYECYPHYRERPLLQGLYVDPRTGLLCWAEQEELAPPSKAVRFADQHTAPEATVAPGNGDSIRKSCRPRRSPDAIPLPIPRARRCGAL